MTEPASGTSFGRYRLLELLGRGGMGEVWRAHDTEIDRVVAIKMLLPRYAQDPEFDKRFRREARAAARLDDPHIVPIYDVGEIDGRLYVTMRLILARDLQSIINEGPLAPARAVHIVGQIASALHHAHRNGLVHRDVKPSNILVDDDDFAYLIDFGIARSTTDTALTDASTTVGTWAYMAPERFSAAEIHPSADVYALACVLYQCLTGVVPFPGDTLEQVAVGHLVGPPPLASQQHDTVPTALDRVIAIGLAKHPADRYPSATDLAVAAEQAMERPTVPHTPASAPADPARASRRTPVVLGAVLAVLLLIVGAAFAVRVLTRPGGQISADPSTSTASAAPTAQDPPPNTGPFTGVYRADFARATTLDGGTPPGGTPLTGVYGVRSACGANGCVATAVVRDGDQIFSPSVVFDKVGDSWLAVTVQQGVCRGQAAEAWQVFRLTSHPDGSLTGDHLRLTANQCAEKRSVTFTRTGDVDVDADFFGLPDPAELPARIVSPAENLHGRYHFTRTYSIASVPTVESDTATTTDCLRSGDRCMSYFVVDSGDLPLVFSDGRWTASDSTDGPCPSGDLSRLTTDISFPLPQPLQNPVTTLTGSGRWVQTGSCAVDLTYTETLTRTGD